MTPQMVAMLVLSGATLSLGVPIGFKLAGQAPGFMNDLGFRAGPRGSASAWSMALGVAAAYIAFSAVKMPEVAHHWKAVSLLKALSILAAIAAGIVEEAIFRRWLMDFVMKRGARAWTQVTLSGFAFGLVHGTWGLLGGVHVALAAVLATTALGIALGSVYLIGSRSLAPCILAHVLIDGVIEPGLLLSAMN
jgi:membrane protease YdiL (CAAX protease family)